MHQMRRKERKSRGEYTSPTVAFARLSFLISSQSLGTGQGTSTTVERVFVIVNGRYAHSRTSFDRPGCFVLDQVEAESLRIENSKCSIDVERCQNDLDLIDPYLRFVSSGH